MYIDINWKARTDGDFRSRLDALIDGIAAAEAKDTPMARQRVKEMVVDVWRLCHYNPGFLVPYFFPRFHMTKDGPAPLSFQARPFAFCMTHWQVGGYICVRAGRQVAKSTSLAVRQLIFSHIIRSYRSLYVTPHQNFLDTYKNRLEAVQNQFRFFRRYPNLRNNLTYKQLPNLSEINLVKCWTDSTEARSKTADEILYDEYQLFDVNLEQDIRPVQKSSDMPSTVYAGTSTTLDSPLEWRFENSSRGFWFVRSADGKHWINCGDKEDVLKVVQPQGPTCPFTGRILDMRNGLFVHADRSKLDMFPGFHIPQIIIPEYAHDPIKWAEFYRDYKDFGLNKFLQECLGIPVEEGLREISVNDLKAICLNPDGPAERLRKAQSGYYRYIISGCDWGGSDYNPATKTKISYTVHVILGIRDDWKIEILHMKRYSGMDWRSVAADISEDQRRFKTNALGSDFGGGDTYNMLLREAGTVKVDRHLILNYGGLAPISSCNSELYNLFNINRTESISQLYMAIKDQDIICYDWEESKDYLMDLMNMYRAPTESAGGRRGFQYIRPGSKSDDTLHAMNFAHILTRLYRRHPIVQDKALELTLQQRLGVRGPRPGFGPGGGGGFVAG